MFARRARPDSHRRKARAAVCSGTLMFALATAGLVVAAETVKPEWRDPEYGHRLQQVRQRMKKRPHQPLVVVLGSSRAQIGVSPYHMGFPDEPGQPFVYNFGYRGATPHFVYLQLARLLDAGVKPRAVVVVLAALEINNGAGAEQIYPAWGARMSGADLRHLAPYVSDPNVYRRGRSVARSDPWAARRTALVSDLLPDWQDSAAKFHHHIWERMDRFGAIPFPEEYTTDELRQAIWAEVRAGHPPILNGPVPGIVADRALRDLVARCRAEGIAVAVAWAPESPAYRALYTPTALDRLEGYRAALRRDLEIPVFPAPTHLDEEDFLDGFHLLPKGGEMYSRWLADTHLRPWLADVLKK